MGGAERLGDGDEALEEDELYGGEEGEKRYEAEQEGFLADMDARLDALREGLDKYEAFLDDLERNKPGPITVFWSNGGRGGSHTIG